MRKIVATEFITLDGVYQGPGGAEEDTSGGFTKGGWCFQFWDDEPMKYKWDELRTTGALLLGRRTYEIFAGAWPTLTDDEVLAMAKDAGGDAAGMESEMPGENAFANKMNSLPKYVLSTTLDRVEWQNSELIKGDVAAELRRLKQEPGGDIVIHGSGETVRRLMQDDLIDEYRLMVFPVVLGEGMRLFQGGLDTQNLKLTDTKTFQTGVIVLTYEPAPLRG